MSLSKAVFGVLLVFQLAGCGFRPLYGETSREDVIQDFSEIQVAPIKDRIGPQLKNELELLLHSRGKSIKPRYRLSAVLNESKSSLAVKKSAVATRANLLLQSRFKLQVLRTGGSVEVWTNTITVSYNILDSEFATLMAEKDARKRAVQELAQEARVTLGAVLGSEEKKAR